MLNRNFKNPSNAELLYKWLENGGSRDVGWRRRGDTHTSDISLNLNFCKYNLLKMTSLLWSRNCVIPWANSLPFWRYIKFLLTEKGVHYPMNEGLSKQIIKICSKILKVKMHSSPIALLNFTLPEILSIAKNLSRSYFKSLLILENV